jgi:hypothetical protein
MVPPGQSWLGWVTYGSSRLILVGLGNLRFLQVKDFYLNTPMARYENMQLCIANMPDNVIKHYKLTNLTTPDGDVYCEIQKRMYGLPQAGIIAQQLFEEQL